MRKKRLSEEEIDLTMEIIITLGLDKNQNYSLIDSNKRELIIGGKKVKIPASLNDIKQINKNYDRDDYIIFRPLSNPKHMSVLFEETWSNNDDIQSIEMEDVEGFKYAYAIDNNKNKINSSVYKLPLRGTYEYECDILVYIGCMLLIHGYNKIQIDNYNKITKINR